MLRNNSNLTGREYLSSIEGKKTYKAGRCIGGVLFLLKKNKPLSEGMSSAFNKYQPLFKKHIWPDDKKKCFPARKNLNQIQDTSICLGGGEIGEMGVGYAMGLNELISSPEYLQNFKVGLACGCLNTNLGCSKVY